MAELAKRNKRWWDMFRDTYPLSKFGMPSKWFTTEYTWMREKGETEGEDPYEPAWYE